VEVVSSMYRLIDMQDSWLIPSGISLTLMCPLSDRLVSRGRELLEMFGGSGVASQVLLTRREKFCT
jgi:hypothetical protein